MVINKLNGIIFIMSKTFSAIVTEEDGGFVALNPDTDVASQGDTLDEAIANLKEALELYFEETGEQSQAKIPQSTFLTIVTI
jgi:predicted RNase H-like HicB family nuclease